MTVVEDNVDFSGMGLGFRVLHFLLQSETGMLQIPIGEPTAKRKYEESGS